MSPRLHGFFPQHPDSNSGQTVAEDRSASEFELFQTLQDSRRNRQGLTMGLAEILRLRLPDHYTQMGVPDKIARLEAEASQDEDWAEVAGELYGVLQQHLSVSYRAVSDQHEFITNSTQLMEGLTKAQAGLVAGPTGRMKSCEKNVALCAIVKDASR